MDNVSVSVIIPIYNVEDYLVDCLNSIEHQTLNNIEIILVDDGSTDNSLKIAKQYAERNNNYTVITRKNGGLSVARNTGLEKAKGEYVYFLDSDDYLAFDALEKLYTKAKKDDLDTLRFCAYTFEDGTTDYQWSRKTKLGGYKYQGVYNGIYKGVDFYKEMLNNDDYYPSCCLIFIKRKVSEENKLRFYEGILHEDNLFSFELTMLCERVAVLNEPLYFRRVRKGSITQQTNWIEKNKSMYVSAIETDKFIDAHPFLKGKTSARQIHLYLNMMLWNWNQMTREDKESRESREYFNLAKPLLRKYKNTEGISLKLFYISPSLYEIYKYAKETVSNVVHRS